MQTQYRVIAAVACFAAFLSTTTAAEAADVTVTAITGPVTITAAGHPVPATVAAKLTLPLEIHTGAAGTLDLLQLGSRIHVGPNSVLVLPDSAATTGPLDRILQKAGYVLYNIKSRKEHPLAIETPYLVSVVKGTVFTIAVEDHAATVALMEGSLDISAPGVADHVLLKPNESIRHAAGEPRLSVQANAPAALVAPAESPSLHATSLPDSASATQMAQVARDFADAGAAVAPSALAATRQVPTNLQSASATTSGTSSSGNSTATSGTATGSTTSTGTSSGSAASGSLTAANGTGTAGNSSGAAAGTPSSSGSSTSASSTAATGSSTSTGATASTGTAGSSTGTSSSGSSTGTTSSGSSASTGSHSTGSTVTVTLPLVTVTVGCNGKTNGTGNGKCLGHVKID